MKSAGAKKDNAVPGQGSFNMDPVFLNQPPKESVASICLVRLSALGDVVMVLPLVKMLQREWPGAKITWIVGLQAFPLIAFLEEQGVEIIPVPKPRFPADYLSIRKLLENRVFDVLFCLQASFRANLLYPLINARRKIGYSADRAKDMHSLFIREKVSPAHSHIVDGFFQFARKLGGVPIPSDHEGAWNLAIAPAARLWAGQTLPPTRFAAINPCASKPERNWHPQGYAEAIRHLWHAHRMPAVLLGGRHPREKSLAGAIRQKLPSRINETIIDLVGKTTLPQLAAAIDKSAVLLAPDTGAVHIARALNKPVAGLYAIAPAHRTGPYRQTGFCVGKYYDAVRFFSKKEPENIPWSHRVHDMRAMSLITGDEVCRQIDRAIASM